MCICILHSVTGNGMWQGHGRCESRARYSVARTTGAFTHLPLLPVSVAGGASPGPQATDNSTALIVTEEKRTSADGYRTCILLHRTFYCSIIRYYDRGAGLLFLYTTDDPAGTSPLGRALLKLNTSQFSCAMSLDATPEKPSYGLAAEEGRRSPSGSPAAHQPVRCVSTAEHPSQTS